MRLALLFLMFQLGCSLVRGSLILVLCGTLWYLLVRLQLLPAFVPGPMMYLVPVVFLLRVLEL